MIAKKAPGRAGGGGSFKDIAEYITAEKVVDPSTGEEVKKTIHVETENLLSEETAIAEMDAVALQNTRCKDPVYHCIASWPYGEKPTLEQAMEAGRKIVDDLGYKDHQAVIAYHDNTDNPHIHIAINRVNPDTGKVHAPYNDFETLHRSCREIEISQGWSHGRGAFEIDGNGEIKQRDGYEDRETGLRTEARDFEAWTGEKSFTGWIKESPARDVKAVLDQGGNWQDLHRSLAKHNLEIQPKGSGMVIVDRDNSDAYHAKASDLGRFATAKNLEAKLGPYESPAVITQIERPERDYKRDPEKRLDRREERKEEREKFYSQYKTHKQEHYQTRSAKMKGVTAERKATLEQIKEQKKTAREEIKKQLIPGKEKQVLYSAVRLEAARQKEQLDRQTEAKRQTIREQYPDKTLSLRDYAQDRAQNAENEQDRQTARAVLRGIVYREKREVGTVDLHREGFTDPDEKEREPVMKPGREIDQNRDKKNQENQDRSVLDTLEITVSRHGNISYRNEGGKEILMDTGRHLFFTGAADKDAGTIEAGLRLAREKFGNNIQLNGSEEFKKRACEQAVKLGINVTNGEMTPYLYQLKQARQQQQQQTKQQELQQQRPGPSRGGMER